MSTWKPYAYQLEVSQMLLQGQSVVLQAPTGAGKHRAATLPFLHSWHAETKDRFPLKCIYVVPMRVLANQFVQENWELADSISRRYRRKLAVTIQTGDQPQDRRFEGNLIFCTVDQFLSSYLTMPYSLPNRLANLNAGAMVGSYIVFDEFHLLDPGSTLPTVLYALKQLRQVAPVLLMTATFSKSMLKTLAKELDAVDLLVSPAEAYKIETRDGKLPPRQRVWRTADQLLTAEAVLNAHQKRTLALCNTVQRAQTLFRELQRLLIQCQQKIRVLLLHSRFLPEDRQKIENEILALFGPDAQQDESAIVIATQTIEVGVNITCDILHTELAPASALIQRAGRCARFPGQHGQVIVYSVESYMPYGQEKPSNPAEEAPWVKEMKAAWVWLQAHNGHLFDFAQEQALVDAVATPRDEKVLAALASGRETRSADIHRVLAGDREGQDQRLLIRDADTRLVLIHPNPDELLQNPYGATGFALQPGTLHGMFKEWQARELEDEPEWRVQWLREDKDTTADREERNRTEYSWQPLYDGSLLTGARAIVVHPALAGYLADEGFVAGQGDTGFISTLPTAATAQTWEGYSYRVESYEEHLRLVLQAFQELALPEILFSAQALEKAAGWKPGSVIQAAWLTCLLHDVGKLAKDWQAWAHAYQRQIDMPVATDFAVAHTETEWGNRRHEAAAKAIHGKYPKPHHAGESALAASPILVNALGQNHKALVCAAITAIVRHHTPFARECGVYTLIKSAQRHIEQTLMYVPETVRGQINAKQLKGEITMPPNSFTNLLVTPDQPFAWLAYTLLARALRRADQEGTARGSKEC